MSIVAFNMILDLIKEALPEGETLPKSYRVARTLNRGLGLDYIPIHACVNDCILFWKETEKLEVCPVCGESRWVNSETKWKKVPRKVLRHFPLIPRLQKLFISKRTAEDMRWHREKRIQDDDNLRHPADSLA